MNPKGNEVDLTSWVQVQIHLFVCFQYWHRRQCYLCMYILQNVMIIGKSVYCAVQVINRHLPYLQSTESCLATDEGTTENISEFQVGIKPNIAYSETFSGVPTTIARQLSVDCE